MVERVEVVSAYGIVIIVILTFVFILLSLSPFIDSRNEDDSDPLNAVERPSSHSPLAAHHRR